MTNPSDDPRLSELLEDAVSDVEPRESLADIRHQIRNRTRGTSMSARRPWSYAVGGAVAVAAVVAAIAVAGDQLGLTGSDEQPGPAASSHHRHRAARSAQTDPAAEASTSGPSDPDQTSGTLTLAGYYLGDTPSGPRLFRQFDEVAASSPLEGALTLLSSTPADADYSTPWSVGELSDATVGADSLGVVVDDSRAERPAGMTEQEASEAVQQVVYTLQAAAGSRLPVRFSLDTVLGVDTSQPVAAGDPLEVLSLVSISDPAEGTSVSGSFTATGVASSFEATVPWEIRQGDQVVKKGFATAEGWMDKLYPWQTTVDVSDLAPGDYTFVAMTDDPSAGEGKGPFVDTRTITVK